ncbi:MAG: universal stress protein [Aquamicrobium sp.]|uniref:universal stress protein n=1 Tax=Aquamicrobium sp. TaxID=1872579 RepID=UPI00349E5940|nr:universal stress protein [Aquamicrobium sp.]
MKLQAFLPLVTYTDPNSDAVAANATAVAALLGADLGVLAVNVTIPQVSNALSRFLIDVPDMIRQAETTSRKHGERLIAAVEAAGKAAGVAVSAETIAESQPLLSATAALQARYHDIVLIGLEEGNPTSRTTAESVVFGSGRPVVLLPETVDAGAFDHVAIAWDGSRVAARAAADARPFLARAKKVSVLTVADEKKLVVEDGARLAESLRRGGIEAEAAVLHGKGAAVARTLQDGAKERGCGLLVMGGYGHSRVRDFVMGGATEGVLKSLSMPVMLSH